MIRGDSDWDSITESTLKPTAWKTGSGLYYSFTYKNIAVNTTTLPTGNNNTSIIISLLDEHPEGIVLYRHFDNSHQHAVLLTDYTDGVFYCADPLGSRPSGRIPISDAYYVTITEATQYWYVTSPKVSLYTEAPSVAILSTDKTCYAVDETVTFTMTTNGTVNNLWIYCPNGDTLTYSDVGNTYMLAFGMSGDFEALVQTWNGIGSKASDRIRFHVGKPQKSIIQCNKTLYHVDETVTFTMDTDGTVNNLWIYCPNGDTLTYSDIGNTYTLAFGMSGDFEALVQTWNGIGSKISDRIRFHVGIPKKSVLQCDKTSYQVDETVTFTMDTDGTINNLWIYCPNGEALTYFDVGNTYTLTFGISGDYEALVQTWNGLGEKTSDRIRFHVGVPQKSILQCDKTMYQVGETVSFTMDTDGAVNNLWIYCPNGETLTYSDVGNSYTLTFGVPGHYKALVQTWNRVGSKTSEITEFFVGNLSASLSINADAFGISESVLFSFGGLNSGTYTIVIYKSSECVLTETFTGNSYEYIPSEAGLYSAYCIAYPTGTPSAENVTSDWVGWQVKDNYPYVSLSVDKETYSTGETVHFTMSGENTGVYTLYIFKGSECIATETIEENSFDYSATGPGSYSAYCTAYSYYNSSDSNLVEWKIECSHIWNSESVTTPATCKSTGKKTFNCTVCGETKTETIAKDASNHTGGTEIRDAIAVTCGADGYSGDTYCLGCGVKLETGAVIPKTGNHTWNNGSVTTPATCKDTGVKTFTCMICGETKTDTVAKDASNHAGGTEVRGAVAVTCGTDGYIGDTYCKGCGVKLETGAVLPKTGNHTWNEGVVTVPATYDAEGEMTYTCTVCRKTKTDPIAPLTKPADPDAVITVATVTALPGKTATVTLDLSKYAPMAYLRLTLSYDTNVFTLNDISSSGLFTTLDQGTNLVFSADEDIISGGTLLTLTFTVSEDAAPGEYPVTLICRECYNSSELPLYVLIENGKIVIPEVLIGDVNGDGIVDGRDLIRLRKYLADLDDETGASTVEITLGAEVTGDGVIDGRDLIRLRRYLAYYDDETGTSTVTLG